MLKRLLLIPTLNQLKKHRKNFLGEKAMGGANGELFNMLKKRRPKSFLPQEPNPEPDELDESNPEPE